MIGSGAALGRPGGTDRHRCRSGCCGWSNTVTYGRCSCQSRLACGCSRGADARLVHKPDLIERHRNVAFAKTQVPAHPDHHRLDFAAAVEDQITDVTDSVAVVAAVDIQPLQT